MTTALLIFPHPQMAAHPVPKQNGEDGRFNV
jgi:hypothetical protein